jgi:hypothetical protein
MEQVATMDFRADEFLALPVEGRIRKCRALAENARQVAASTDLSFRSDYMQLAYHWSELADEIEKLAA